MIEREDPEFEREVFRQNSPIAVPVQLTADREGGVRLLAYSFAVPVCEEFEKQYGDDPLSPEALDFLTEALKPMMEPYGFDECDTESYPLIEYRPGDVSRLADPFPAVLVDTLDGETWHEDLPLDEFRLDPADPADRMAAVRDADGRIVCFAGLNDISEDEGICELNVECAEEYRGRGYGPACVSLLAGYLDELGRESQYLTSHLNLPSVRCAEKAGLCPVRKVFPVVFRKSGVDDAEFYDFT